MVGVVGATMVMMGGVVARTVTIRPENSTVILRRDALVAALRNLKDVVNQRHSKVSAVRQQQQKLAILCAAMQSGSPSAALTSV